MQGLSPRARRSYHPCSRYIFPACMINCIARIQNTNALPCMEAGASAYPQIPSFIPNPGTGIHLYPAEQRSQPSQSAIPRSARAGVISSSRKVFYMYKQEPQKFFFFKKMMTFTTPRRAQLVGGTSFIRARRNVTISRLQGSNMGN